MYFIFAGITFYFIDNNPLGWIISVGLIGTIFNYFSGDLFVLPSLGNVFTSISDGLAGGFIVYIMDLSFENFSISLLSLVVFSVLTVLGEYFFHIYVLSQEEVEP